MESSKIKIQYKLLKPYLEYAKDTLFDLNDAGYIQLVDRLARYELGGLLRDKDGGVRSRFDNGCMLEFNLDPATAPDLFKKIETIPTLKMPVIVKDKDSETKSKIASSKKKG